MTRPFVEREPDPGREVRTCEDCGQSYYIGLGHACNPHGLRRGLLLALVVSVLFWLLILRTAGVIDWGPVWAAGC